MRIQKIDTGRDMPNAGCSIVGCGRVVTASYLVWLDSPDGSLTGALAGCVVHAPVVAEFSKSKLRAEWYDDTELSSNLYPIFCSVADCDETSVADRLGWLGLNLLADVGGNRTFSTFFSCPMHARSLAAAVSREIGGTTCRRAYVFRSSKGPIGALFAMESMGFAAVTGMSPVTGDDILWPFGNLDEAVKKLDESIADFKKTRPDVQVVRRTEMEGKRKDVMMLCPRCGGLLTPFGEKLRVGESSTVSGLRCHNCGFVLPSFNRRRVPPRS